MISFDYANLVFNVCKSILKQFSTLVLVVYIQTFKWWFFTTTLRYICRSISYPHVEGPSWSWSHCIWIYIYLCTQCLSPVKLWVRIPFMASCTRCNIMWSILSVTCDRSVVFYTNKTDRNDTGTTEIFQMKPACGKQIQDEEKQNKNTRQHVSDTTTRNQTRMVWTW